jgi:hypothetical protein
MTPPKTYAFLEAYVCRNYSGPRPQLNSTIFYELAEREIVEAEKILGFSFPSGLRNFYTEVGMGCLPVPQHPQPGQNYTTANEILHPMVVAHFARGELEWQGQDRWMAEDAYDEIESGDLPFFEMYDSSYFMVLKTASQNPDAVWYRGRKKIEDSFEAFIRNLYYDGPDYYVRNW